MRQASAELVAEIPNNIAAQAKERAKDWKLLFFYLSTD
jgi:hypothetical protein